LKDIVEEGEEPRDGECKTEESEEAELDDDGHVCLDGAVDFGVGGIDLEGVETGLFFDEHVDVVEGVENGLGKLAGGPCFEVSVEEGDEDSEETGDVHGQEDGSHLLFEHGETVINGGRAGRDTTEMEEGEPVTGEGDEEEGVEGV